MYETYATDVGRLIAERGLVDGWHRYILPQSLVDYVGPAAKRTFLKAKTASTSAILWTFYIAYHEIYDSPVLLFAGNLLQGGPICDIVTAVQMVNGLPFKNSDIYHIGQVVQQTGSPLFYIHPCRTHDVMKMLAPQCNTTRTDCAHGWSRLEQWLSLYGQPFGGIIDSLYCHKCEVQELQQKTQPL